MCGIAGFVGAGVEADLMKMIGSIRYRGPDFQGTVIKENVGLAHARLSIIDLDRRSNQPFFSPDGRFGMVFNGEVYNYLDLKDALERTGKYTFVTTSDTEVVLFAYAEFGKSFLQKIDGMFALAIYDFDEREMLLAKDRMGKKPLYYTVQGKTLIFASEMKAVLTHPLVKRNLDLNALNEYLTFDYVPVPHTIIKNIYQVKGSNYVVFKSTAEIERITYWRPAFEKSDISYPSAQIKLDQLLDRAVGRRLMSDVPLGVFLSGGLDSSTVAYYASKHSTHKLQTFSIGFNEKSYDESRYARMVAAQLGTDHNEKILTVSHAIDLIPEVYGKLDEPFADPSIIPTYLLSTFTKEKVTVCIGGDGSDELLAGYPTFISEQLARYFHALPKSAIHFLDWITDLIPVSDKNISFDFKVKQFLKGFEQGRMHTHALWLGSFRPGMKARLFTADAKNQLSNGDGLHIVDTYVDEVKNEEYFDQLLYTYYRTYLQSDILTKVDRASMYTSLEVRAPFLDTALVNFVNSLPKKYKIKGNQGKRILKDTMRGKLPDQIIDRPKKGFGIPVSLWLKNELRELTTELLSKKQIEEQGIFEYHIVQKLLSEHHKGQKNHRKLLWNMMVFQLWFNGYA
jgi:asparagine synthase (glutamine-hydrolysing)